jgi:hypothetical protein
MTMAAFIPATGKSVKLNKAPTSAIRLEPAKDRHKEYTRQELYDLVWTTPLVKLAKRYGLSDVGLRKICVKHDIPTPPPGRSSIYSEGAT